MPIVAQPHALNKCATAPSQAEITIIQAMTQSALSPAAVQPLSRQHILGQGILFVVGFATFILGLFGVSGTLLGDVFYEARDIVRIVGGIVLVLFGLFTLRPFNIPWLYSDTRAGLHTLTRYSGGLRAYLTGLSFAAGWTPCIGPFLGAILSLSVTTDLGPRMLMLSTYVLGLGVPFLLTAALADRAVPILRRMQKHMRLVEIVSGILLIAVGLLLLGGQLARMSRALASINNELEFLLLGDATLNVPVAAVAGLLSFLSPCVLPLIPAYIGFISGSALQQAAAGGTTR